MQKLVQFLALALLTVPAIGFAGETSVNMTVLNNQFNLPQMPNGSNVNDNFVDVLTTGVAIKGGPEGFLFVEAQVEMRSTAKMAAVCRLVPHSFLGRPIDPSNISSEFYMQSAWNQGLNPQPIVTITTTSRAISAKMAAGTGGAFYKLQCRRDIDNAPATISYASLKLTYQAK